MSILSQQIIAGLKADLAASQSNEARERSQAAGQLGGFKEEVARLSYEVSSVWELTFSVPRSAGLSDYVVL